MSRTRPTLRPCSQTKAGAVQASGTTRCTKITTARTTVTATAATTGTRRESETCVETFNAAIALVAPTAVSRMRMLPLVEVEVAETEAMTVTEALTETETERERETKSETETEKEKEREREREAVTAPVIEVTTGILVIGIVEGIDERLFKIFY